MNFLLSGRVQDMSLLFSEQRQKKQRMDFWDCHVRSHEAFKEHVHSLKEIIIYCLPTQCWNLQLTWSSVGSSAVACSHFLNRDCKDGFGFWGMGKWAMIPQDYSPWWKHIQSIILLDILVFNFHDSLNTLLIIKDYSLEGESREVNKNWMFSDMFKVNFDLLIFNQSCQPEK